MIYFNRIFSNYEEFKELFGVQEHGNGNKSRRNKILLALLKSRELLHMEANAPEEWDVSIRRGLNPKMGDYTTFERYFSEKSHPFGVRWDCILSMPRLFDAVDSALHHRSYDRNVRIKMGKSKYCYTSDLYETDDFAGLCEDGDWRSIRYVNKERGRVFKMRAGKFMRNLIEEYKEFDDVLPEQVKIWFCEEFAERWKAYASQQSSGYKLVVDDDFESIYDSDCCVGDFGSCMVNDGYWTFYRDAVDAKAASLRNEDGDIVARCIIYTDVHTSDDKVIRLAERQYSSDGDEMLKRQLVMALIAAGEIDGYKRVGADCHSPRMFVDVNGNPFEDTDFWIPCRLDYGDTVSYQDSFKWYDMDGQRAWNCSGDGDIDLAITEGTLEDNHEHESWSDYNSEWIDDDDAYYVETRGDYFHGCQVVYAHRDCYEEDCFEDDCIRIGSEYYYAGRNCGDYENNGIGYCPECEEYYLLEDGVYSEVTEEDYCCDDCREAAEERYKEKYWFYSEYDEEYFENKDEIDTVLQWNVLTFSYEKTTIHHDSLMELFENGEAVEIDGVVYIDDIGFDGEPVHFCAAELCVA